jgi:hypothetical protein
MKTETLAEKKEAEVLINRLREEEMPRLRAEFNAREAEKDVRSTLTIATIC